MTNPNFTSKIVVVDRISKSKCTRNSISTLEQLCVLHKYGSMFNNLTNKFQDQFSVFHLFFFFGFVEGLFCIIWLLAIPSDTDHVLMIGLSPFRIILIAVAIIGSLVFLGLLLKSLFNMDWLENLEKWFEKVFSREVIFTFGLGNLMVLGVCGAVFLIFTYSRSSFRLTPSILVSIEFLRALMTRLSPMVFWITALCLQMIISLIMCGYCTRSRLYRIYCFISLVIFPATVVSIIVLSIIDPRYYKFITKEDNLVEWLTFAFLMISGILSAVLAIRAQRSYSRYFWFYAAFAVVCLLFALEEISWGQRIIGVNSPRFFLEYSDQQEINVHNVLQEILDFRTKHVAAYLLFIYGVCLPVLTINQKIRKVIKGIGIILPPLVLSLGFLIAGILMVDYFTGREEEVGELLFALCFLLFMLHEFLLSNPHDVHETLVKV